MNKQLWLGGGATRPQGALTFASCSSSGCTANIMPPPKVGHLEVHSGNKAAAESAWLLKGGGRWSCLWLMCWGACKMNVVCLLLEMCSLCVAATSLHVPCVLLHASWKEGAPTNYRKVAWLVACFRMVGPTA